MDITVKEAAEALSVSTWFVASIYTGERRPIRETNRAVDTELLCEILNLDHRFMMAFLAGYDVALDMNMISFLAGHDIRHCYRYFRTIPVFVVPSKTPKHGRFGKVALVRYSYRRVAPLLQAKLEKKNGNNRASRYGGGALMPPPDTLPPDTWTFRSTLTTEGTRLPWARRTVLEDGRASALTVPERGPKWGGRRPYSRSSNHDVE
jgi:hypothetical protein